MTRAQYLKIDIKRGEPYTLSLALNKSNGSVKSLWGYTAKLTVRDREGGSILFEMTNSPYTGIYIRGGTGHLWINISSAVTSTFSFTRAKYDLLLTSKTGINTYLLYGNFIVDSTTASPTGIATSVPNDKFSVGDNFQTSLMIEQLLGLAHHGYDHHSLLPENSCQFVYNKDWYASHAYQQLDPHVLCYNRTTKKFDDEAAATAWVVAHPGMEYIFCNEMDIEWDSWGEATMIEYADLYHYASSLIRASDATAKFYLGGWCFGIANHNSNSPYTYNPSDYNENDMLSYYYSTYGQIDMQAVTLHSYQKTVYNNPYITSELTKMGEYTDAWLAAGWTSTNKIILSEFGWNGGNEVALGNNTPENCANFMDWFIPIMDADAHVLRWHWWEWGAGAHLVNDGVVTDLGQHYSDMARA